MLLQPYQNNPFVIDTLISHGGMTCMDYHFCGMETFLHRLFRDSFLVGDHLQIFNSFQSRELPDLGFDAKPDLEGLHKFHVLTV
jgi:hypothetical protein